MTIERRSSTASNELTEKTIHENGINNNNEKTQEKTEKDCFSWKSFFTSWTTFSSSIKSWWPIFIYYLKGSTVEFIISLYIFALLMQAMALPQLIQDKICMQLFSNQTSEEFCRHFAKTPNSHVKDAILAKGAILHTYKEYIIMIPGILSVLFIGSWCDRYPSGKRFCTLSTLTTQVIQSALFFLCAMTMDSSVYWIFVSMIPPAIFGNGVGFYTSLFAFMSVHIKDDKERAVRFITIGLAVSIALPAAMFMGGSLLAMDPWFNRHQYHNYGGNFLVSTIFSILTLITTYFVIKKDPLIKKPDRTGKVKEIKETSFSNHVNTTTTSSHQDTQNQNQESKKSRKLTFSEKLKDLFSFQNFIGVWKTCTRKRDGNLRLRIYLLIIALTLSQIPFHARMIIGFPVVQRLYHWDAVHLAHVSALSGVFHIFAMLAFIPILFKVIDANDCQTSMIAIFLTVIGDIFMGSILNPWGFYLHAIVTSFTNGIGSGIRSYFSKYLPKDEAASFFGFTVILDEMMKGVSGGIFSFILKQTISSYITFSFHFMALILIICLALVAYVDVVTPQDVGTKEKEEKEKKQQEKQENENKAEKTQL